MKSMEMRVWKFVAAVGILWFTCWSFAPALYELSKKDALPPIRSFELVHNFPTDFNFYLSRIREGLEGEVLATERYTSEPHAGSMIHILYVILGQVGRMHGMPQSASSLVYHAARIAFGVTFLSLLIWAAYVSGNRHKEEGEGAFLPPFFAATAFMLGVTASSWPKLVFVDGVPRFGGYMAWWSLMDSLQRITFIPHLLLGQALILFLVVAVTDLDTMQKRSNWIILGVAAAVLGIVFPPGLVFLYAVLGVWFILFVLLRIAARRVLHVFFGIATIGAIALPSMLYLFYMTSFYPWKRLAEFDILHPLYFEYMEYFRAVGPILITGSIGAVVAIFRRSRAALPFVSWVIAWGVVLFVFRYVPSQSPLRFTEMVPHIPLAILSVFLGSWVISFAKEVSRRVRQSWIADGAIIVTTFLLGGVIVLGVFQMASSYLWQRDFVDHKVRSTYPLVPTGTYVMYPLKDFLAAISFLEQHSHRTDVVLSETTAGNYIPVYAGNTVFVGHDNTVHAEDKKEMVKRFFQGGFTAEDAYAFLHAQRISYVFFGPQEAEDGASDLTKHYPFLTPAYTNEYITVYKVP